METLDGGQVLPERWRGGIVALGNFDGVHLGHQAVISRAFDRARRSGRPAMVVTFDPHPVRYFKPDAAPFRLTTVAQRARMLGEMGIDAMVVMPFDALLAGLDATAFFDRILVERLGSGGLVTGEGFHFGRGRDGHVALLRRLGRPHDIEVDAEVPIMLGGATISSTRVREALRAGNGVAAADLLSRPFVMEGIACEDASGTSISLGEYVRPQAATYRVRVRSAHMTWRGMARIVNGARDGGKDRVWLPTMFPTERLEVELLHRAAE